MLRPEFPGVSIREQQHIPVVCWRERPRETEKRERERASELSRYVIFTETSGLHFGPYRLFLVGVPSFHILDRFAGLWPIVRAHGAVIDGIQRLVEQEPPRTPAHKQKGYGMDLCIKTSPETGMVPQVLGLINSFGKSMRQGTWSRMSRATLAQL